MKVDKIISQNAEILKVEALSEDEMNELLGGTMDKNPEFNDEHDCTSELASGGGTTDAD